MQSDPVSVSGSLVLTWPSLAVHLCLGKRRPAHSVVVVPAVPPAETSRFMVFIVGTWFTLSTIYCMLLLTIILCITLNLKAVQH